jgi:hypothetical protein
VTRPIPSRGGTGRWRSGRLLLAALLLWLAADGRADTDVDTYAVDGQPVLLYKIIQWWYDAPAAQAPWICGRTLTCHTRAPLRVAYTPTGRRLTLHIEAGFAELTWPKIPGERGVPARLHPIWIDPAYLEAAVTVVTSYADADAGGHTARLCLKGVTPVQARQWMSVATGLELVLAGPVRGLIGLDGRIALVDDPALIKVCPQRASGRASPGSASRAMTLTLRHRPTERVLAIFARQSTGG